MVEKVFPNSNWDGVELENRQDSKFLSRTTFSGLLPGKPSILNHVSDSLERREYLDWNVYENHSEVFSINQSELKYWTKTFNFSKRKQKSKRRELPADDLVTAYTIYPSGDEII